MYSNDSFNTPTKARKFSFCCPGAPMKKPRLSNDEPLLINDVNVKFLDDVFTLNELRVYLENGSEIEFTYRTDKVRKMIPYRLTDELNYYLLTAYSNDETGNKTWRRFKVHLMNKL
jgi:hypothetical protein